MIKLCVLFVYTSTVIDAKLFGWLQPSSLDGLQKSFEVYWNVPTFMCHQYGMYFENISNFHIRQNRKDAFRGDEIAILYDPGVFPALLKDKNGRIRRNGGVPQEGNLTYHLDLFERHTKALITDASFKGLAIIDFESWRPIFRQNWASLAPYRDLSLDIERQRHPFWKKKDIEKEAVRRFEKSGRTFMEETLKLAKDLRPLASWGYYHYPYCYNLSPGQPSARCDPKVFEENDRMSWLFKLQDIILPSVYLRKNLTGTEKIGLINGRVKEASRISKRFRKHPVLPYFWYKYKDSTDIFLSKEDVYNSLKEIVCLGANGFIIWGSSNDVNTREKCQNLVDYVTNTLGPIVRDFIVEAKVEKTSSRASKTLLQTTEGNFLNNFENDQQSFATSTENVTLANFAEMLRTQTSDDELEVQPSVMLEV